MKENERRRRRKRRRKRKENVKPLISSWNKPFIGLVGGNEWLRSKKMDGQDHLSWKMGVAGNERFSREGKLINYSDWWVAACQEKDNCLYVYERIYSERGISLLGLWAISWKRFPERDLSGEAQHISWERFSKVGLSFPKRDTPFGYQDMVSLVENFL